MSKDDEVTDVEDFDDFIEDIAKLDYHKGINDDSREVDVTPKLGTPAYQIGHEETDAGDIIPTITKTFVQTIYHDGTIQLMNQESSPIYFNLEKAIMEFKDMATQIRDEYAQRVTNADVMIESITDKFIKEQIEQSAKKGATCNSFSSMFSGMFNDNEEQYFVSNPEAVEPRFSVGQTVYALLQKSDSTMNGESPKNEFEIVTTTVNKIEINIYRDDPPIFYSYEMAYRVDDDRIFATYEETLRKRVEIVEALSKHYQSLLKNTLEPKTAITSEENIRRSFE